MWNNFSYLRVWFLLLLFATSVQHFSIHNQHSTELIFFNPIFIYTWQLPWNSCAHVFFWPTHFIWFSDILKFTWAFWIYFYTSGSVYRHLRPKQGVFLLIAWYCVIISWNVAKLIHILHIATLACLFSHGVLYKLEFYTKLIL